MPFGLRSSPDVHQDMRVIPFEKGRKVRLVMNFDQCVPPLPGAREQQTEKLWKNAMYAAVVYFGLLNNIRDLREPHNKIACLSSENSHESFVLS